MPPAAHDISLTTPVADLPGIGPARAADFRALGIRCVADLIQHFPHRYERELGEHSVADASTEVSPVHGAAANLAVRGEVLSTRLRPGKRGRFEAQLFDGTGTVLLTWFNSPYLRHKIHPNAQLRAWGKAQRYGDTLQLVNPKWEFVKADEDAHRQGERLRPIYPGSEHLTTALIESTIARTLGPALALLDDHLPAAYRTERKLPTLAEAYRLIHAPNDEDDVAYGRRRLAYDELLLLQLGVMLKRRQRRDQFRALPLNRTKQIDERIRARFPFDLTVSQRVVIEQIVRDLQRDIPMNRLLQGDVGAGKTVVALYAMLMAVASKHQACLMAPTELLAEQHFSTITDMLRDSRVTIELLTGSLPASRRKSIAARLAAGDIDLVIGTHALITDSLSFRSLAVAVIDEQHRFGVHQRAVLRAKSDDPSLAAHTLVMTATPIPRTLSLTIFGDLDVSTIEGLPPGRMPISTRVVGETQTDTVYDYIAKRLRKGEQAYIVVPVIDESDSGLKDVGTHLDRLSKGPFHGLRLDAMHGRLKREEREQVMQRFRKGDIDALIATTVIEVGVDVPNASIMVIEHSDRFGLAQLHQLRGRIGRGKRRSLCVLIGDPTNPDAIARLEAIRSTTDGFKIAEKDFEIRGPGELFGTRQSGLPPFRSAEFPRDAKLLAMARRDAEQWIDASPALDRPDESILRKRLLKAYGRSLGLGDVA
jgi:ATP-dependent DNA helicase RecG